MKKRNLLLPITTFVVGMVMAPSVFASSPSTIANWSELNTCLTSSETTCTLAQGFVAGDTTSTIQINGTKTLDLNSATVTGDGANTLFGLIENTSLNITGTGIIDANYSGTGIRVKNNDSSSTVGSTHLTIGKDVTLKDTAIVVSSNSGNSNYGSLIDIYGKINNTKNFGLTVNGQIANKTNAPVINIYDGAEVTSTKTAALYLAGYATTNIDKATINGTSAVAIKAGNLNLNGATLNATGAYEANPEPSDTGINTSGAALQIEAGNIYAGDINININTGSTLSSKEGNAIQAYGNADEEKISALKLNGDDISLKSAEGKSVLAVSEDIKDNFPTVIANGEELALEDLTTEFTIKKPENVQQVEQVQQKNETNPNTVDSIVTYFAVAVMSLIGLVGITIQKKLLKKN